MAGVDVVIVTDECHRVVKFLPAYRTNGRRRQRHPDKSLTSDDLSHVSYVVSSFSVILHLYCNAEADPEIMFKGHLQCLFLGAKGTKRA